MRAAIITTAAVLVVFVAWATLREASPNAARESTTSEAPSGALPDVAAAPARGEPNPGDDGEPAYEPATVGTPRSHVVAEGETLATISRAHYGDDTHADAIYAANRDQIRDPAQLHAGQVLLLP